MSDVKRQHFRATVTDADGNMIDKRHTYAWNSAIRASEAIVREYARLNELMYAGDPCTRVEDTYTREWYPFGGVWTGTAGAQLTATVERVA